MHSKSRTSRIAVLAASGIAAAALVAGCGSSGGGSTSSGSTSTSTSTAPATPSSPASPGSPSAPAGAVTLQTATDPKLGTIVTDGAGFTLYRFDKDTAMPPMSNCNGNCASTWPPAPANGAATVKGIDSKLVGTVTRADGSKQLTLNGWPAYRYAPDTKPGDTKGQGVGGIWFALTPTGGKAGAPSGGTTPSTPSSPSSPKAPSSPGSGYGGY
ncbi:hypothetical protein J5Y04_25445 [Kitasatospora sp. RG8]|uniref:hypothetical protein n=1 Tax=Kitasatospora sp. RG8 TaxID=2820815 RepID=UPI001ADF2617|nr:hypothetical protein [Kitasatospora sp. RG8]